MEQGVLQILHELNDDIPDDVQVDLLGEGIIDSFDIANIVSSLEEYFAIEIPAEEIVPENFSSVRQIAILVQKCKQ